MPKPLLKGWPLAIALVLIGAPSPRPSEEELFAARMRFQAEAGCPVETRAGEEGLLFRCTDAALGVRISSYIEEHPRQRLTLLSTERVPEGTRVTFVHESVAIMDYGFGVEE